MKKVNFFRKKYPRFVYENYSWKISKNPRTRASTVRSRNLEVFFDFKIESAEDGPPQICFKPKVIIKNIDKNRIKRIGDRVVDDLVFNLGLIELLSYWKATCSPEIIIKASSLSGEQIKWWKNLIIKGMGQFFYENKIDFRKPNFLKITAKSKNYKKSTIVGNLSLLQNRVLVPIGGGKDSVVTLEILKKAKKELNSFSLNPTEAAKKIMKMADCKNVIIVRRKIDEKLLELNRQGFLNGHTPFSAYLSFLGVLVAALFDYKYIALSNERSSNEGNVKYLGRIINHQWSKSFDFEKKFRDYSKKYLAKDIEYFSFLRPLYDIQIAKLFSQYPKYFNAFLSCNVAYQTVSGTKKPIKKWCGKCAKCLFVFTILYPFIEEKKLIKIFKRNFFQDKTLLSTMQELIGERGFKPFECVGTKKETLIAFYLSLQKYLKKSTGVEKFKFPFLLKYFEKKIIPKYPNLERESKKLMNSWNKQNNLLPHLNSIFAMAWKQLNNRELGNSQS